MGGRATGCIRRRRLICDLGQVFRKEVWRKASLYNVLTAEARMRRGMRVLRVNHVLIKIDAEEWVCVLSHVRCSKGDSSGALE